MVCAFFLSAFCMVVCSLVQTDLLTDAVQKQSLKAISLFYLNWQKGCWLWICLCSVRFKFNHERHHV